jgi:hypothetical protein
MGSATGTGERPLDAIAIYPGGSARRFSVATDRYSNRAAVSCHADRRIATRRASRSYAKPARRKPSA